MIELSPDMEVLLKLCRELEKQRIRVFPKYIQAVCPFNMHEGTYRRKLKKLGEFGLLERIGGPQARRGWRVNVGYCRELGLAV